MTSGVVLGKFLPPHKGHQYLIDFARHFADDITVYVDSLPDQEIPGELRARWLRQMFPNARIVHPDRVNPQYPEDHPDFWQIWSTSMLDATNGPVDYLFASEDYGQKLADVIGSTFIPVDIERGSIPISGTMIRQDPMRHWESLTRVTRPYFAKRVCVFGPESTGKSTLVKDLASHFDTVAVPEYARTLIEQQQGEIEAADMVTIARGQIANEDALAFNANRLLVCDTDPLTTTIWSDWLFGECDPWILEAAEQRTYDLYLVTDVDVPWVADQVRYLPEARQSFFDRCITELTSRNRPFHVVTGSWDERLASAIEAVREILR